MRIPGWVAGRRQRLTAEEASAWEAERARFNLERMPWGMGVGAVIHVFHLVVFGGAEPPGVSPAEAHWHHLVATWHAVALPVALAGLGLTLLARKRPWPRFRALVPAPFGAFYVLMAAASAGVDQLVTTAITPYVTVALALTVVFRWRPSHAAAQNLLGLVALVWGQLTYQADEATRLANLTNGLTVVLLNLLATVSLERLARHDFLQRRTIRRQAEEQEATLGYLRDLAERSEAASQAKSAFLATMSHEIRTPLTGVLGANELLAGTPLTSAQQALVRTVAQAGQSLLGILGDVLDFSKIEAGMLALETAPFDLKDLVETLRRLFAGKAVEKGLALTVQWPEGTHRRYLGDALRLQQVLSNLVSNALKFTEHGGVRVEVSAAPSGEQEQLTLKVVDTGIGLDAAAQARLFQAYGQAEASTTRRYGGTGLGLVISRKLVEAMGGTLTLASAPGQGSTFTVAVALPRAAAAPASAPARAAAAFTGRVLVAEDNPVNMLVARQLLGQLGVEVVEARDGEAALKALEGCEVDLVMTDLQMPRLDGYELARALRGRGLSTPIIAMSADVLAEDRARCLQAGMNGFVSKPFTRADLARTLAEWLPALAPPDAAVHPLPELSRPSPVPLPTRQAASR